MESKRPKNNFDNPFARAIFKAKLKRKAKDASMKTNVQARRSKSFHSSINDDLGETPPIEGEA